MNEDLKSQLRDLLPGDVGEEELDALVKPYSALGSAVEPVSVPTALRDRLLASIESPEERLAPFAGRLAALFDVGLETAGNYLRSIFDPDSWSEAIATGIALVHLEGGPATAGADVGFTRVAPGTRFPEHTHGGQESVLVLAGRFRDSDGSVKSAGDFATMPEGSTHWFEVLGEEELIFAVVVYGVDFDHGERDSTA